MRIAAISDLHGYLPEIPECDVLVVAGDLGPARRWYHKGMSEAKHWLSLDFTRWLNLVPAKHIVGIAGNHDFVAEHHPDLMDSLPWNYLCDSSVTIEGVKFWGSPYTPPFNNWAFNDEDPARWDGIPSDVDIVVTHGPPLGIADRTVGGLNVGSSSLKAWMNVWDQQGLHLFGHIHECHGQKGEWWANVSYVNERYEPSGDKIFTKTILVPTTPEATNG